MIRHSRMARQSVAVVVLGDIGRSPRMQYHALSLVNQAHMSVDFIGYTDTAPSIEISESPHIRIRVRARAPAESLWHAILTSVCS